MSKNSAWKFKDGEQWKGRRKYKMKYQVKEVKISTALYSIAHCQKWKIFPNSKNFFGLWQYVS